MQNKALYEKDSSIVIARQIDISGARQFAIMDQQQFALQYAALDRRSFFEVLPNTKKKKLYLDIDIRRNETDLTETGDLVINFLKYSSAVIQKLFCLEVTIEDWFLLNSSTPSKASYHAILNHRILRFVDLNSMKKIVEYLIQSYESEVRTLDIRSGTGIKIVDSNVYHNNQNMRMFLSTKLGRANVLNIDPRDLHILKLSSESMDDITIQVILASLITQNTPESLVAETTDAFKQIFGNPTTSHLTVAIETRLESNRLDQNRQLQEFVTKKFGAAIKYVNVKSNCLYVLLDPPLLCPYLGRVHSQNNVYLMINLDKRSWTEICHGSLCKNKVGSLGIIII